MVQVGGVFLVVVLVDDIGGGERVGKPFVEFEALRLRFALGARAIVLGFGFFVIRVGQLADLGLYACRVKGRKLLVLSGDCTDCY